MENTKRSEQVIAMVTPAQRKALEDLAAREQRTVSTLVQLILFPHRDEPDRPIDPASVFTNLAA